MKMVKLGLITKSETGEFVYPVVMVAVEAINVEKTDSLPTGGCRLVLTNGNTLDVDESWADIMEACGHDPYAMMEE
jgi:hypothetical protein